MKTRLHTLIAAIMFGLFATGPVALADGDGASDSNAASSKGGPSFSEVALAQLKALFGADEKTDADAPSTFAGSEHPIIRNPT